MPLHLFSTPGEDDLRYVVEASRPYLEDKEDPIVAYMPLASLYAEKWHGLNQRALAGLGQLVEINAELMAQREIEAVIRDAALVYITGGNTFLLSHRLHASGVMPYLKKKVQNGLPVVAVSAGMVICGPNIRTSRDMNTVETTFFSGLHASPGWATRRSLSWSRTYWTTCGPRSAPAAAWPLTGASTRSAPLPCWCWMTWGHSR